MGPSSVPQSFANLPLYPRWDKVQLAQLRVLLLLPIRCQSRTIHWDLDSYHSAILYQTRAAAGTRVFLCNKVT